MGRVLHQGGSPVTLNPDEDMLVWADGSAEAF